MSRTPKQQKEYIKNNPEQYKKHLERVSRYKKTKKGKKVEGKARKNFRKKNPNYFSDYSKKWRKKKCNKKIIRK